MPNTSDGVREMTLTLQVLASIQRFSDAWIDTTCSLMRAYLSKDPASETLAKEIQKGNGAIGYIPTEDADEIAARMKKEGITCSKGVSFHTMNGQRITAIAYPLEDAAKAQEILSDYNAAIASRKEGLPDAFLATKGGLVTPLDMNRYSGSLMREYEKTTDMETSMLTAQYAKRAGVPMYIEGPGDDDRFRIYYADRDKEKVERIRREVCKDMSGRSGEYLRKRLRWENDLYMDTREHLFDNREMKSRSAIISEDGSMIVAGRINSKNGKPVYHNGEPEYTSNLFYTVINPNGECRYIRRPPNDEKSRAELEVALAKMKNPVPVNEKSFAYYSKLNSHQQWSYIMTVQEDDFNKPTLSEEDIESIAEEREMSDDAEHAMDVENGGQGNDIDPDEYRDDQDEYGMTDDEMEEFLAACAATEVSNEASVEYSDSCAEKFRDTVTENTTINFQQMVEISEADLIHERDENDIDEREAPEFTDTIDDELMSDLGSGSDDDGR